MYVVRRYLNTERDADRLTVYRQNIPFILDDVVTIAQKQSMLDLFQKARSKGIPHRAFI